MPKWKEFWRQFPTRLALQVSCAIPAAGVAYLVRGALARWGVLDSLSNDIGEWLRVSVTADQAGWTISATLALLLYWGAVWMLRPAHSPSAASAVSPRSDANANRRPLNTITGPSAATNLATVINKPIIFISYARADEADSGGKWLSFVRQYLSPAVKNGVFELWADTELVGGADWDTEIERKLRECDVFVLLVSPRSMASNYIVDREMEIIQDRRSRNETVHFYPLLITPTPDAGLNKVRSNNLRPTNARPLSSFSEHDRMQQMTDIANEIASIANGIANRRAPQRPVVRAVLPAHVHISDLPETPYERLVGRDSELLRLDQGWEDPRVNILSLVAEGGAGKSALVNEWLKRAQMRNYDGAEIVLGWSFYSQGNKERATSAEPFLDWAISRLGLSTLPNATAKGEAIAEAMAQRRILLVLDGVEPLQHGPGPQVGELKDQGLRALLRHFAAAPSVGPHGLIVITSRVAIKDISNWRETAPVHLVDRLSDIAGADLLRDNGVWGTDNELVEATHDFGGHPLALALLASFLKETQGSDVRRRDHIRAYIADRENARHDHAKRVMESYEKEWLAGQPILHAIMYIIGLFDRPASPDCLGALREAPIIEGVSEAIVHLDDAGWDRAVARLREVRLLSPADPASPGALDSHPLIREWFGERLHDVSEAAWKAAHGRLFEFLRDTTMEGDTPTLEALAPLYQAIVHGCRAGRHQEALDAIYVDRICRRTGDGAIEFYSNKVLGALGSNLAAIFWFFATPYSMPIAKLNDGDKSFVLNEAAIFLRGQGRLTEALATYRATLALCEALGATANASTSACSLSETELLLGHVDAAIASAEKSVALASAATDNMRITARLATCADALHAAGREADAERMFADAERRQTAAQPSYPLLYSSRGVQYCDLLLAKGDWVAARDRARTTLEWVRDEKWLLDIARDELILGRACLGVALAKSISATSRRSETLEAGARLNAAIDGLRAAGQSIFVPGALLGRASFRRAIGDWNGAMRDLDEAAEIAEPGPMRLYLCDVAVERARLAIAQIEAFAPLGGFTDERISRVRLSDADIKRLREETARQLNIAAGAVMACGYHRRDGELVELQAVLRGDCSFASLRPRV